MGWTSPYLSGEQSGCDPLDTACVNAQLAAQAGAMDAKFQADLSAFRAACNRDWLANDAIYASLGVTRPPNNCGERTFGLTPPGGYTSNAGPTSTYTFAHDYPTFTPPVAVVPAAVVQAVKTATQPAIVTVASPSTAPPVQNYIAQGTSFLEDSHQIAGFNVSNLALIAAGIGALFLFKGGR